MERLWKVIDLGSPPRSPPGLAYSVTFIGSAIAAAGTAALFASTGICLPFLFGLGATILSAWIGRGWHTLLAGSIMIGSGVAVAPRGLDVIQPTHLYFLALFVAVLAFASETIATLSARSDNQCWRLSQREAHLQSIFHLMPAPMLVFHRRGDILAINAAACSLFGIEAGDARFVRIDALIDCDDDRDAVEGIETAIERAANSECPTTGWKRSGETLQLMLAIARVEMQTVNLWTLYIRDETASRAASARRAVVDAEIAQIGRAAALGAMGSAIAHELNQPLAAAANYAGAAASLIKRLPYAHAIAPTVDAIDRTIEQILSASAIVRELRSFVQYAPVVDEWMDLAIIIAEATRLSHFFMDKNRAKLIVKTPDDLGEVFVDRVQIGQVLLNLLNNAAEAVAGRDERLVRLTVTIRSPSMVEVGVIDSGAGVSAAMLATLFTPFRTSKPTGLGIGLAISRKIVEAHDSVLRYEVASAGGAHFLFALRYRCREAQ